MKSILIVDDSLAIREAVSALLAGSDYVVEHAEDGQHGLEVAQLKQFDLVISDQNMPNMNGLDLVDALRQLDGYKHTPMLMLTSDPDPLLKQRGRDLGLIGWLLKPISPHKFKPTIEKLLA